GSPRWPPSAHTRDDPPPCSGRPLAPPGAPARLGDRGRSPPSASAAADPSGAFEFVRAREPPGPPDEGLNWSFVHKCFPATGCIREKWPVTSAGGDSRGAPGGRGGAEGTTWGWWGGPARGGEGGRAQRRARRAAWRSRFAWARRSRRFSGADAGAIAGRDGD